MDSHDRPGGLGDQTQPIRRALPKMDEQYGSKPAPRPGQGYLSYTYYRRILDQKMTQVTAGLEGLVLDVGGEWHSRRGTFRPPKRPDLSWVCINIDSSALPDVIADAAYVPCADGCADAVICTEVLEHVAEPEAVIFEAYRLLRSGGIFVLSMPFIGHVHADPFDFQRYTATKLRLVLSQAAFHDIEIDPMGHYYAVLCEMIKGALARLRPTVLRWMLAAPIVPIINTLVTRELRPGYIPSPYMQGYTLGYFAKAVKP